MLATQRQLRFDLKLFLSCVTILVGIGLLFIYSSSSIFALERFGSASFFVRKQGFGLLIGLLALIIARILPLQFLKKTSALFFVGSLALTALTLYGPLAHTIHGARRWLFLPGFSFQPSELLKLSLIIFIAQILTTKGTQLTAGKRAYFPVLTVLGITSLLLLMQPDFGMTVALAAMTFTLLFIAHCPLSYLTATLAPLIPVVCMLIYLKPYRLQRILTFLNPWADPQGAGFQIIQSLIAIGSGSFWGVGISHSKQKFFYLPMQHTDFIFSIIAEETGFVGSLLLITLYMLFLYAGIRIACRFTDPFAFFVTLGFVILTSLQAAINLAVATGLAPTKGVGLPFVSYGNTGLICNLFMIGLIINMVRNNR